MDYRRAEERLRWKWIILSLRLLEKARRECKFSRLLEIRELLALARLQGAVVMAQVHLTRSQRGENPGQPENMDGIGLEELDQIINKMESEDNDNGPDDDDAEERD